MIACCLPVVETKVCFYRSQICAIGCKVCVVSQKWWKLEACM
jgi:hypothetical protein